MPESLLKAGEAGNDPANPCNLQHAQDGGVTDRQQHPAVLVARAAVRAGQGVDS
jgi:hypothetical protein